MDDAFTDERDSSRSEPLSSDEYEIEEILAHRWSGKHRCFKYFVKWKGCPPEENWWVLETHLNKQAKDAYNEKLEEERARKPMNKTDPTKDFIVPDDVIISGVITSSSSSAPNISVHDDNNPDKPGTSTQDATVLEQRRKSKKRHLRKKQSREKSDGRLLSKNKKSPGTRRAFLESDSSSSEGFFDNGGESVESPKKRRLESPPDAYHPAPKLVMSPAAQKERKDVASVKKESLGVGTHANSGLHVAHTAKVKSVGTSQGEHKYKAVPDHVVPSSTAAFTDQPSAHPGKQVPSTKRDSDVNAPLSEEEKVLQCRRRVRESIESVIWKKVTFDKMIHRDYYANIAPNVAALEKKLFEVHQSTKGGYKRWCQDFFAVLNDELNVLFKVVLYGHLTPAELVTLSAEQMQAPRFRIKFPPSSLGPDETCSKPMSSNSARRHNNVD